MMQFQYAKVSENNTSFSSYRGIKVLSALFHKVLKQQSSLSKEDKRSLYPIHTVSTVPGHLAVSFHDGRQFVVFDAVPHQLRLSSIEAQKLQRFVLNEVNDYLKNILAMKTNSNVVHLSFLNPSQSNMRGRAMQRQQSKQNVANKPSSSTKAKLKQPIARKLQLLAVHSDGGIIIWNWNQIRYLWQYKIRKILPSPLSDATARANYMNNINNKLYEKERPGVLAFCSVITSPPHLIKIPCLDKRIEQTVTNASERQYIKAFENLLYPQQNVYIRSNTGSIALSSRNTSSSSHFSGHINHEGSLYFIMIDYMMGDQDMVNKSNVYDIHRYLLNKNFPGIATKKTVSTRFIISRVRFDVDHGSMNAPMMSGASGPIEQNDQSKFEDFRILMDGLEEIDFWSDYYADKDIDNAEDIDDTNNDKNVEEKDEEEEEEQDMRRRVIMIIEHVWTTRYGFIIEITVRRTNNYRKMTGASMMSSASHSSSQAAYDVDLAEICIEKRLLYYVSPFMDQMIRIPFPSTKLTEKDYDKTKAKRKAKDEKMRNKSKSGRMKPRLNAANLEKQQRAENNKMNQPTPKKINISFVEKSKQEIMRFVVGQHGTTKQLLLWDRFDNSFYILDENQLPKSSLSEYEFNYHKNKRDQLQKHGNKLSQSALKHLKPKFDLPFGHFSDRSRRIEWKYICRFDLPNEAFYDPTKIVSDTSISGKYKSINQQMKIWGYHDWICVNVTHDVYYIHLTNIVLHRRYLYHQYTHYKKEQEKQSMREKLKDKENDDLSDSDFEDDEEDNDEHKIRLQFPSPVYLSPLYREINPSIPQRHQSFNLKRNNSLIVQRRRLFSHEWSYYDENKDQQENDEDEEKKQKEQKEQQQEDEKKDNEDEWKEDDHEILACAVSSLPADVENVSDYFVVKDFGIWTRDSIFRLNMQHLHEQVEAVNSCYEPCQSILGGLNLLARWGETSLIARSKYLTDFLSQQSSLNDKIKSAQVQEALKIAPFPLLVALLNKYPQFDSLLLRHYQRTRDDFPKFTFNYGRIFGKKVMQNILYYMDHIYKTRPPLPILNSAKDIEKQKRLRKESKLNSSRPASFIAQDLAILSGEVSMDYDADLGVTMYTRNKTSTIDEGDEDAESDNLDDELMVDMDEIRTLISSDLPSDLNLLEKKLKLDGIRNDPFDPESFETSPQFLCRILLLPASFRSSDVVEVTTPLKLLASLCRFYDLIYPVATFRLIQLLCHYQRTSSKKIALSALQGLPHVKHDLTHLPDTLIMFKQDKDNMSIKSQSAQPKINDKDKNKDEIKQVEVKQEEEEENKDDEKEEIIEMVHDDSIDRQRREFDLFEERIVSRVILCKIAHQYYDMLDNLLMTPLTLSRLNNAIETCKRFHERLSDIQKAAIFKRLLSAWLEVKLRQYRNSNNNPQQQQNKAIESKQEQKDQAKDDDNNDNMSDDEDDENMDIGSDWIIKLRPNGYNGFHFMQQITEEIRNRKEKRIVKICNDINNCISNENNSKEMDKHKKDLNNILKGEIPILAGKDDIPVSVVRPVLMIFAAELHPHR